MPANFELTGRTTIVNTDGDAVHIGTVFGVEQIDRTGHEQKVPCQEQVRESAPRIVLFVLHKGLFLPSTAEVRTS